MSWEKNYNYWISNAPKNVVEIIKKYKTEEKILYFDNEISFGTAGLREKMGYGSSLINEFNIAKYSLAIAKLYLLKYDTDAKKSGIVIAHDNRNNSIFYSEIIAKVISAMDIPVYLFNENKLQPTPLISYVISNGDYVGGINVTASHNPSDYNGIKVYDHLGSQLLPNDTDKIIEFSSKIKNIFDINQDINNIFYLDDKVETNYVNLILKEIPFKDITKNNNIKVVYSASNGTAGKLATSIMNKMKVDFVMVEEQLNPDPDFKNTKSPNPQDPDSFILARKYGDKHNADVLFCVDPDADRFGIEIKHQGNWHHIDGNQLPLIQINYKLQQLAKLNKLNNDDFIVRSIVTSIAADRIADKYGIKVYKSLTGFKWLIHEALKHKNKFNESLFVWEESYGSTINLFTRDKDSFQALVQSIEIISYYKEKGLTLLDVLDSIYQEIGYFEFYQIQKKIEGINSLEKIDSILNQIRNYKSKDKIDEYIIEEIIDFSKGYKDFLKQNFIIIKFENDIRVILRPSGTEPVLRIYFDVPGKTKKEAYTNLIKLRGIFEDFLNKI